MYRLIAFITMKNTVFKIREAVATQGGAMEARDHFKNGASSKSLMSRGKFVLLGILMLFVSSCDNEEEGGNRPKIEFTIQNRDALRQTLFADETQGTSISFVISGDWYSFVRGAGNESGMVDKPIYLSCLPSFMQEYENATYWLSCNPASGNDGTQTMTICLKPNNTNKDRTDTITVSSSFDWSELFSVIITQKATMKNEKLYPLSMTNRQALHQCIAADQTQGESVTFAAHAAWTTRINPQEATSWISVDPKSGGAGTHTASVTLAPNAMKSRSAEIIISCDGKEEVINVMQCYTKKDGSFSLNADVYVGGYDGAQGNVWKNGILQGIEMQPFMEQKKYTNINSVFVDGNDVYAAGNGCSSYGDFLPAFWKNGVLQEHHGSTGRVNSIYAINSQNVIMAGNFFLAGIQAYVARSWLNEFDYFNSLLVGGQYIASNAHSVYVANSVVYTAGYEIETVDGKSISIPKIWKYEHTDASWMRNPIVAENLVDKTKTAGGVALSVHVSGNDVYAAGWENNEHDVCVAKLWKNGDGQNLTDGSFPAQAQSVFVSGDDVYVAGWENNEHGNPIAKLWKNGVAKTLPKLEIYAYTTSRDSEAESRFGSSANSVYVVGNDVYVAGWQNDNNAHIPELLGNTTAVLWVNDLACLLHQAAENEIEFFYDVNAKATSVFAK